MEKINVSTFVKRGPSREALFDSLRLGLPVSFATDTAAIFKSSGKHHVKSIKRLDERCFDTWVVEYTLIGKNKENQKVIYSTRSRTGIFEEVDYVLNCLQYQNYFSDSAGVKEVLPLLLVSVSVGHGFIADCIKKFFIEWLQWYFRCTGVSDEQLGKKISGFSDWYNRLLNASSVKQAHVERCQSFFKK
jgi:hypothetical protein